MKNKPLRHKETNTFKFQPFSERLANINVDIFHYVKHPYEESSEECETFFYQALQKWNVLNLSESYDLLRKEITNNVQTLPQLLSQKDHLVHVLLNNLENSNLLSLQATLEFVVALARDLRQEFYVYYTEFLTKLIGLLNTKDTNQIEWTFTCLAYLFKFLWRHLVRDLAAVFESLLPLLSSSKPQYINNFAAESFAFVARKVNDKRSFLKLILKSLLKYPDGIDGCGRLLFETVRGISGQFHTCAETLLIFLLDSLFDESLPQKILFKVLTHLVVCITENINSKNSQVFWRNIQLVIEKSCLSDNFDKPETTMEGMTCLLSLIETSLQHKGGVFLLNPSSFVETLVNILKHREWNDGVYTVIINVVSALLQGFRINLSQEVSSKLIRNILSINSKLIVKLFVLKTLNYGGFETFVLPGAIDLCSKLDTLDSLNLLSKIVVNKVPPSLMVENFQLWSRYPLNLSQSYKEYIQRLYHQLFDILNVNSIEEITGNVDNVCAALLILPHLQDLDQTIYDNVLLVINLICKYIQNIKEDLPLQISIFILSLALECLLHCAKDKVLSIYEDVVETLLPFAKQPKHLMALKCLDIVIFLFGKKRNSKINTMVLRDLKDNLSSPFHKVRLITAHILFELENGEKRKILSIIHSAELVPVTVQNYREKLKQLQLLVCNNSLKEFDYAEYPLKYLLGCFYINFKLIWEPVMKLISSYANLLPAEQFWDIFGSQLHTSVENIKQSKQIIEVHFECDLANTLFLNYNSLEDKPDYFNYRIILWENMIHFPEVCEVKNRDISNLFLSFLNDEFLRKDMGLATSWNIKRNTKCGMDCLIEKDIDLAESKEKYMELNEETRDNESSTPLSLEELNKSKRLTGKSYTKNLLAHLTLFSKLRNPRSMFREPELNKAYFEFLTHKNPAIQRTALDCIITYRNQSIIPYKDHLYGLIEDKTFKNEVTLFRIDTDSDLIKPEHRSDVISIVLRIVYSKMLNKSGIRTGSNNSNHIRKKTVFRFLAGCKQEELLEFLQMAFRILTPMVKDNITIMVHEIITNLNLEQIVPPKRLLSAVNLLKVVMSQCGSLMGDGLLQFLLRILLCIGSIIFSALQAREDLYPGYINILNNIRNLCIDSLTMFFNLFENYVWTADELDTVFEIFIWPWLHKLPVEGIHSPTSLMKLFTSWTYNPRYFILLSKHSIENDAISPLPFIMKLLLGNKVHGSVLNAIMEMVERMLTLSETTEEAHHVPTINVPQLPVNNILTLSEEITTKFKMIGELNFGSKLLLPHIQPILEYIKKKMTKNGPKRGLPQRDVNILSRITEFVTDENLSDCLLTILLPIINKKSMYGEDVICPLLKTVSNLLKNVQNPSKCLRKLAPLFGTILGSEPRKILTNIVISIASKENKLDVNILNDLNAWDAKWLDQPDYLRRLDAFKKIKELINKEEMTIELGIIIIYTCYHYLRTEKDLSLKDNASQCLRVLCPSLSRIAHKEKDFVINQTILTFLSVGIRDRKNETVQQESIAVLGYMARECDYLHPVLADLSVLGNKVDMEVDFFENLQHLQLHRNVRALLKFCNTSKTLLKPPSTRTLTQFILPLLSKFLCSEKYLNKNSIIDAAIEALGITCRFLPWFQYEMVLRHYLGKLKHAIEYQKQLIRIVITILNAFHFDISQGFIDVEQNITKHIEKDKNGKEDGVKDFEEMNASYKENDDDDFEEKLIQDFEIEEELIEEKDTVVQQLAIEKKTILNKTAASRVVYILKSGLLPQLNRTITMRVQSDSLHKINRKMAGPDRDEEDILRIPIVLAFVKLLQKLPLKLMEQNLPSVLMKLCTFLKSRLDSVRRVTRETLQKVMATLGPRYLPILLDEMISLMTRGFHVHVLVYSVHSVLTALKEFFKPGDLDICVRQILQVCKMDLFGNLAEEKEVVQIAAKLTEARSTKSYHTFQIMAQYISEKCFLDIILPIKEELTRTLSHKSVIKASECLRQIVLGLVENKFVPVESLLVFAYGISSESIPLLVAGPDKKTIAGCEKDLAFRKRPNIFIIPEEPKRRSKIEGKEITNTNSHILVEFGLRLIYFLLKRERLKGNDFRPHLDPFVVILKDSLKSQHVKLSTLTLQCLGWILKLDLPSLKENLSSITKYLFEILHKYASAGLSKGDNFDLVMAAFKAVATLVRDVKSYTITSDQLRVLLLYCEQDIHDYSRQATAFTLLKAIIKRKLVAPELHSVMTKVAEISITAELDHIRLQARQVFVQFLLDYPLGKNLKKYINFYISQLEYELKPGRQSALDMIKTLLLTFPQDIVITHCELFFVSLGIRLINDDDPDCRKICSGIIMLLLEKIDLKHVDKIFDIVLMWMKDSKVVHRRLGAQLCGIFVAHKKKDFEQHLSLVLPIIINQFIVGFADNHSEYSLKNTENKTVNLKEKLHDHHLYQVMNMIIKITVHCPKLLTDPKYTQEVEILAENAQTLLAHPHEWVRLCSAQFLGKVMSVYSPDDISKIINDPLLERPGFLLNNVREKIRSLSLDLCGQLVPGVEVEDKLLMQTMKNLVFIAEVLTKVTVQDQEKYKLSLTWLVKRFRKLINTEISQASNSTSVRIMSFNWMAAVVLKLDTKDFSEALHHIMAPLVRELNMVENESSSLYQVAKQAANCIKQKIGVEQYNNLLASLTTQLNIKRAERKKERAQQVITQPEKAAKRKITNQLKKKDQKKRKLEHLKGNKPKRKDSKKKLDFGIEV